MSAELIQFNSGDHVLGGKNIAEAITTDGDIIFNESYIVVGNLLEGVHIHATYDLRVLGSIKAEQITVNGSLFVDGDIDADTLICRGVFICSGTVKVTRAELSGYSVADSLVSGELHAAGDVFVRATVDTNILLDVEGLVVTGEGIMGVGSFKAKAAIANEYYEFSGESDSNILEISTMDFPAHADALMRKPIPVQADLDSIDIGTAVASFNSAFSRSMNDWANLEENELISAIRSTVNDLPDLYSVDNIINFIVDLSYERAITNFRDYLYILFAKHVFPDELAKYETLEPVLFGMFDAATIKINEMAFKAKDIGDFARSIYILSKYYSDLPVSLEECADKIFSSIGLRYSTVEHAWRTHNG